VFTPGSNPRRLPAAAYRRGSWFLSSSRRDGSRRRRRAEWRGGEDTNAPFSSRSRPTRACGSVALATVVRYLLEREEGEAETVRRARGTAHGSRKKEKEKKRPLRVYDDGAERVSRSSRSGQKRIIGCVMTEECPCSPREATLGASPRRRTAAGRAYVSIIPRTNAPRARRRFEKQTVAAPFEVHLHGGLRDPGEEHPLNVALSQNAPRLRVFYVRFCR
jgi:hypothetical protein